MVRNIDQVTHVGAKRKRNSNENVLAIDRGVSRQKRLRTMSTTRNSFSDETDIGLDTLVSSSFTAQEEMSGNEIKENEEEEGKNDSSSMYLKTDIVSCLSTSSIVSCRR